MYRQGDLLFVRCSVIPDNTVHTVDGVIARGQATTHTHRVVSGGKLLASGADMFIRATGTVVVVHEEHGTIELPVGNYKVIRQKEYEPAGWRQVAD